VGKTLKVYGEMNGDGLLAIARNMGLKVFGVEA
jgi:hypothetical protein